MDFSRLLKHKIIQFGGMFGGRLSEKSMNSAENCSPAEKTFRQRLEDLSQNDETSDEADEIKRIIALISLAKKKDSSVLENIARHARDLLGTSVEKKDVQSAITALVEENALVQGHLLVGRVSYDKILSIVVLKVLLDKMLAQAQRGRGDLIELLAKKCYVGSVFVSKALEYLLLKNNVVIEGHLKRNLFDPMIEKTSYLAEMEERTLRLGVIKMMRRKNSSEFMSIEEFNNHLKAEITALVLEFNQFKKKTSSWHDREKAENKRESSASHDEQKMNLSEAWKTLGIEEGAGRTQVKMAFRKIALKFHPDKQLKGTEHTNTRASVNLRFVRLKAAYELILKTFMKK
jgi:hypothetical protein